MRHFTSVLTVAALLMLAAPMSVDAEKLSIDRQNSHNAKRVMAKLHHLSGARNVLERRLQRLKTPEVDARTPEMKATQAEIARETAEIKAKIAEVESRNMAVQANTTNVTTRDTRPGITSGVKQFFDAPHCSSSSTFRVLETRFHDVCARTDMSFVRRHWYDLGRANQAYNKFCTSACAGAINDLLQHTEGYTCFQSDVLTELRLFSALCQNAPKAPNAPPGPEVRCGAEVAVSGVFDGVTSHCEAGTMISNKNACQNDGACQWDNDMQMCQERITAQVIEKECSACYIKIVDVVSSDFNSICAKKSNQFCLPKLFEMNRILEHHNHSFSSAMLDAVCQDAVMVPCFRAMDVGYDNKDISEARRTWVSCMTLGVMSDAACTNNFQRVLQRIDTNVAFFSQLCTKNTTVVSNAPKYCYHVTQDTSAHKGCPATQASMATCDTGCASDSGRFLEEAGCCAPYVDFVPTVAPAQFPVSSSIAAPMSSALKRVDHDYVFFNVSMLETCSAKTLYNWQADSTCFNPAGQSGPITFWTVLNHAAVTSATPRQRDGLLFAMKLDIGKSAGVVVNDITVSLAAKTMDGVSGTEVSFTLRGTPASTADAKAQWDAAASHRVMTRSDEAIRLCRTCKPDTEASIVPKTFEKIPGAPVDSCNTATFYADYKALLTACGGGAVDAVFALATENLAAANQGWNAACNSQCLAEFKKLKGGPYKSCIPTDVSALGDLVNVGCTKDHNNNRCGAVLTVVGGTDCSALDETQCGTASQCRWNTKNSVCKDQFTEAFLKPKCDGGCITRMAATIGMNGDSFGKEARTLDNLFCSHDKKKLCLPMIQSDINMIDETGLTHDLVTKWCNPDNGARLRCAKRIFSAIASDTIAYAEEDFYHCVEAVMDDATVDHNNKINRIETNCIENVLAASISAVDQTDSMLNNMCAKNAAGNYCMQFVHKFENHTCLSNLLTQNSCPSTCTSSIDTDLTELGCCTGNLQEVYGFLPFANLPMEDVPEFETFEDYGEDIASGGNTLPKGAVTAYDFNGPQPGSAGGGAGVGFIPMGSDFAPLQNEDTIGSPKWYFFANYKTCVGGLGTDGATVYMPYHNTGDLIYKKCKKVRGSKSESRELNLGVAYDTITATPKKQKRFEKKLQTDLSVKLGLSRGDFPSLGMKRNEKQTINLGPVARRRATSSSASTSSITMQTESDSDTTASADAYDTAVTDGTLTLSSTTSLVKNECSNCTSTGSDYTSTSTTTTSSTLTAETNAASSSSSSSVVAATPEPTVSSSSSSAMSSSAAATGSGVAATSVAVAVIAATIAALAF